MPDAYDLELLKPSDEPPPQPMRAERPVWLWLVIAALMLATAGAVYLFVQRRQWTAPVDRRPAPAAAAVQPLGSNALAIDVPPLDQSDAVVRELVRQLSSHPRILAWLATDGLIRTATVAVENVSGGATPAGHFPVLKPTAGFETITRGRELYISPRSYERYDALADAMASIDPAGAARLYTTLKPRVEEAYRDLGYPDTPFDRALERAIVLLLRVPATDARVEPKGIGYGYADPALEGLTGAQKQLLRMGPRNIRIIQSSLRQIALALGIPAERLPPAPAT